MKKYRALLIILLVFLCCLTLYSAYIMIIEINNIVYVVNDSWSPEYLKVLLSPLITMLVFNICVEGFSVFGIVTLSKILTDKQLFTTAVEQLATPNNEEPTVNNDNIN